MDYRVLVHPETCEKAEVYMHLLRSGTLAGARLDRILNVHDFSLSEISLEEFFQALMWTKVPRLFAESEVDGDGSDWTQTELSILGDMGVAVPVQVFDNGDHSSSIVHKKPLDATLLFVPGALLKNLRGGTPVDWEEVVRHREIDPEKYFSLYERRLLPLLLYANQLALERNRKAFITIPGIACNNFAGPFKGQLQGILKQALYRILKKCGENLSHIQAVYFDPYCLCENERKQIHGIDFMVRPLLGGNENKPQLCRPQSYEELGDDFSDCDLFSVVSWDHVSWPGNDYYVGSRSTDDGVKAAATSAMQTLTGFKGTYRASMSRYLPPFGYSTWEEVVLKNKLQLKVIGHLMVLPEHADRA